MENDNNNKHIEDFIKKTLQNSTLETPSADFTSKVMLNIEALEQKKATIYKPLISKRNWFFIAIISLSIVFMVLNIESNTPNWLNTIDFSAVKQLQFNNPFKYITFSKTMSYAIVLFTGMFFIQIPLLKQYFNKHL